MEYVWDIQCNNNMYKVIVSGLLVLGRKVQDLVCVTETATTTITMARRDMMMNGSHVFKKPPSLIKEREQWHSRQVGSILVKPAIIALDHSHGNCHKLSWHYNTLTLNSHIMKVTTHIINPCCKYTFCTMVENYVQRGVLKPQHMQNNILFNMQHKGLDMRLRYSNTDLL